MKRAGLSILELIISVGIFSLIIVGIVALQIAILSNNKIAESRSSIDQKSLTVLRNFATQVRAAQTPYDGSYPIASSTREAVLFYSDINGDGTIERVRYAVENGAFVQGIIKPSGSPLAYNPADESVVSLIQNVMAEPPYFIYYGENFDGSSTTSPLVQPVTPTDVRLVELHLRIESKVKNESNRTLETRAMIRSLKDK